MKSTLISLLASAQAIRLRHQHQAKSEDQCGELPGGLNINPDYAILMGFSSGSYSSGHNLAVSSGTFKGAVCANGSIYGESYGTAIRNDKDGSFDDQIEAQIDKAINRLEDLAGKGQIDPLDNLSGTPVYIHTGGEDKSMPSYNQKAQEGLFDHYGANIMYVTNAENGHDFPDTMPGEGLAFVLGNLGAPGITDDGGNQTPDSSLSQGTTIAFDQTPFINAAMVEHGGEVNTGLDFTRPGYIFTPDVCKTETCNFAIVSHGAGGAADLFVKDFAPWAAPYKTVMVFPQAEKEWDDTAYSGELYDTADGVQPIYLRMLLDHVSGNHVIDTGSDQGSTCSANNKPGGGGGKPERPEGDRPERPASEPSVTPAPATEPSVTNDNQSYDPILEQQWQKWIANMGVDDDSTLKQLWMDWMAKRRENKDSTETKAAQEAFRQYRFSK